jgi:brefeldin A-inhibited guanine nucleotide-exchange protein
MASNEDANQGQPEIFNGNETLEYVEVFERPNSSEETRPQQPEVSVEVSDVADNESEDQEFQETLPEPVDTSAGIMHEIKLSAPPTPDPISALSGNRMRTDSVSTVATTSRPIAQSSLTFVVRALEVIAASKDARKNKELGTAVEKALTAIRGDAIHEQLSPELLFEPLHLASGSADPKVVTAALDCIGKLISYSYFSLPPQESEDQDGPPLIERAIDTICDCFQSEATPVDIQLQIIKSLLSAILNDKIVVHGAGLLKAVRMTYNIFLLSKSSPNQNAAQGALTQMVGTVFERVKTRLELKEARLAVSNPEQERSGEEEDSEILSPPYNNEYKHEKTNGDGDMDDTETVSSVPSDVPVEKRDVQNITLQSFENQQSFDDAKITEAAPTLVTRVKSRKTASRSVSGANGMETTDSASEDEEDEIYIRDAYLVFRAMCRLTTKPLPMEHALDVKSQGMRSKLISLHIIYTILSNHPTAFTSPYSTIRNSSTDEPTSFVQAIKQYLCLSLSRNGASSVKPVFEVSCEIFWLMIKLLRVMLKKEIEVFLKEIYFSILEKRAAPAWQKTLILKMFSRLASEPRALVEVYLNYDCDPTAVDNIFERTVEHLSRISATPVPITPVQQAAYQDYVVKSGGSTSSDWHHRSLPPSLATASMHAQNDSELGFPNEIIMKNESLEVLVEILRSLVSWAQGMIQSDSNMESTSSLPKISGVESRESFDRRDMSFTSPSPRIGTDSPMGVSTPAAEDDPGQFDREKQRKTAMASDIRQFNFKPKRGIKALVKDGFIKSDSPEDIARFLLWNDQINKAALGEFLGEGDEDNIKIMHSFVELMEFRQTRFVDALRQFLQSFRLPGEAQKIDRFMLKFAERYILGNPNAFANADTAYVLSYSVIMLNTDQHSANVKVRMTPEDFIKNNRGINDNADLPDDYLRAIYAEISQNEIVLDTERETAANLGLLPQPSAGLAATLGQVVVNARRDMKREEIEQTEEIANRTEQLYKNLLRAQRKGAKVQVTRFVPASSSKHVGPMFQVTWMSFLTALSGAAQVATNIETVRLCMEGQKLAIRIACLFDLADPRQAFVQSLSRFSSLYNLSEMKVRNLEALKVLLDVAITEGNYLNDSWREILTCVSQLDRFQLISTGVDEGVVPDVMRRNGQDKVAPNSRRSLKPKSRQNRAVSGNIHFQADVAEETRSADIIRSMDRIFTNTANLSGDAILHFVRALTQVSWQEIESSGQKESPRTYSLQKIVEISAYNMTRVRFQWANIWVILGAHFNQVGCHTNTHVVYFALDSLRQLSMKFLDIEELPGFKFQKDFLKPFEHIIGNTAVVAVKDMVLRCLIQMIQAKGANIRSGWRTMFGVFTVAAQEPYGKFRLALHLVGHETYLRLENIVNLAYDHVTQIYNDRFGVVISQGAFADLIVCWTQFSKNHKFQRKALQAIEAIKASIQKMLRTPECPLSIRRASNGDNKQALLDPSRATQTQEEQFWFPVLFAFHDVLMTGEDLEVRSRYVRSIILIMT